MSIPEQNTLAKWAFRMRRSRKRWFNFDAIGAASAAEDHVAASYSTGEVAVLKNQQGGHCIIHPSTKYPGEYQVTYCNHTGFTGDSTYASVEKAVKDALIYGYRVRLEQAEADALMLATVEAEAKYQRSVGAYAQ